MFRPSAKNARRAFSLIEILIVVTIIGILAAIAVPKFANASQLARENALKDSLRSLRSQINVYRTQHNDICPGYPAGNPAGTPTSALTISQLTLPSDVTGNTNATASAIFCFGPYMANLPLNPVNNKSSFKILGPTDLFTADDTTAWLYQPSTGTIAPNLPGNDSSGSPLVGY